MKKRWIELEHYHFATPNGIIDLGNDHQWLLISQKEKQQNIICLLIKIQNTQKTKIKTH